MDELNFKDFDLKTRFIDYWDEVVRQWLEKNNDWDVMTADGTDKAKAATEQRQIIKAINKTLEKDPQYQINTIHMPEPYWGNPEECSIVLLNYNPAGGPRVNRHTTISCKDCKGCEPLTSEDKKIINPTTFIKYVNKKGYSHFAADESPVFKTKEELGADMKWFWDEDNGYEGYGWWQQKCGWLNHLVEIICDKKDEKRWPFAMELCGWHSKEWKTDSSWMDEDPCRTIIKNRTILPLLEAMKKSLWDSSLKIAVCIGAGFSGESLAKFFQGNNQTDVIFKYEGVTKAVYDNINNQIIKKGNVKSEDGKTQYEDLVYNVSYEKDSIHVKANWKEEKKRSKDSGKKEEEKNRNYRVYEIIINDRVEERYYILNTNYRGKNSHPGRHFWEFEKDLINAIKNLNCSADF